MHCPVCGSEDLEPLFAHKNVPVYQHQICRTEEQAKDVTRGDLDFCQCCCCSFVFNRAFEAVKVSYCDVRYSNKQSDSEIFRQHRSQISSLLSIRPDQRVLEIGCGDGSFLRQLREEGKLEYGIGFDPAYVGPDVEDRLEFQARYFAAEDVLPGDAIISRHVIEHIQDPISFLEQIPFDTDLYIETPDFSWTIEYRFVWDFFYEHCSLFSPRSIDALFRKLDRSATCFSVFFGQYMFAVGLAGVIQEPPGNLPQEHLSSIRSVDFATKIEEYRNLLESKRKCVIWGIGAKGVMFANFVDPNRELIRCGADLNSLKIGGFIPGTAHPIVSCDCVEKDSCVILVNPAYECEVRKRLGDAVEVIHI